MFSMEDLKVTCMSRIPEHLSVDTVLPVLSAIGQGDSLGKHHYCKNIKLFFLFSCHT